MKVELPEHIYNVMQRIHDAGHEVFVVGGGLRDQLRGAPVKDWDLATSAEPQQVMALFERTIPSGIEHGTVTIMIDRHPIEVTTYRHEGRYSDRRRPDQVTFVKSIDEDLSRRDFTVNALAYSPWDGPSSNSLFDPYHGLQDLRHKMIRAVGKPQKRFEEDALRIMRAARFAAQLDFDVDDPTFNAMKVAVSNLKEISVERIREELVRLLAAPRRHRGWLLLHDIGFFGAMMPEFEISHDQRNNVVTLLQALPDDPVVLLAAIALTPSGQVTASERNAMNDRLQQLTFSRNDNRYFRGLLTHYQPAQLKRWVDRHNEASGRRYLSGLDQQTLRGLCQLFMALKAPSAQEIVSWLQALNDSGTAIGLHELALDGRDVQAIVGRPAGEQIGAILQDALQLVWNFPHLNQIEPLTQYLIETHREEIL